MAATYPASLKGFTTKADFVDTVLAVTVNDLQNEVAALEANIGTYISVGSGWVGTFDQVTTNWNSLKDRIANIEYGLGSVHGDYVSISGGSTIQPSGTSTVNLTLKAATSQTADIAQFQTSSGAVTSKVDSSGNLYTSGQQVVPVVYSASQPSNVPAGTIWVDSTSEVAILTAQSGVPSGGTTAQVLAKSSNNDYATTWTTINAGTLTGNTLASNVLTSSLTSVGTLGSLSVTGTVTANTLSGNFSGNGSGITNMDTANFNNYIDPFVLMGC